MKLIFALLTLLFFTSAFAQDTTIRVTPYPCDSVVTTIIPQKIRCHDTTVVLSGGNVKRSFIYKFWYNLFQINKDSAYKVCDTIPAHDTTYTCRLCATCYLHDTVITPQALIIRANNQTKTYGQTFIFTNTGTQVSIISGGLKSGDVITADNAASTGSGTTVITGTYTITLSSITIMHGVTNVTANYNISYQAGSLNVGQLPITITANNEGKTAGQVFTFTNNGNQVSVTSGSLVSGDAITFDNSASTGAGSGAAAGTYPITLGSVTIKKSATDVTASYSITFVSGTLTVAASPLIITVQPKPQSKAYGSTFTFLHNGSQVNLTSGGLATGDVITVDNAASSGSGSGATVGSYSITLSSITIMHGATNVTGNYTITYQSGTLIVNAIPVTIQANNQTKTAGDAFTFLHNGTQVSLVSGAFASGDAITVDNAASSGSGSGAAAGSYPITLSSATIKNGATDETANYNITYQAGTFTVVAVNPVQVINGMLPNYSNTATLPQKIAYVKSYSCNAMRSSNDPASTGWPTTQIHAAGLINLMTYNTAPVQQPPDAYPTGAALTAALASFGAVLHAHQNDLPDIICLQNEEINTLYWSGTVQDYINWLYPAIDTVHKYGRPCANGGILSTIIYYMRDVYQKEGKTDSVKIINDRAVIGPGNSGNIPTIIAAFTIEIPALAASKLDYVNLHWYEPNFGLKKLHPNTDTATGLLPLAIKFLESRTGKQVITDEFGIDNASQQLFNQTADEWNDNGVYIRSYYAGDGQTSQSHPQYWADWINAHAFMMRQIQSDWAKLNIKIKQVIL